jgi:hypothetical protein
LIVIRRALAAALSLAALAALAPAHLVGAAMAQNAIDIKAAAASMLARCIAGDDVEKFFGAVDTLFNGEIRKGAMSFEELDAKLK